MTDPFDGKHIRRGGYVPSGELADALDSLAGYKTRLTPMTELERELLNEHSGNEQSVDYLLEANPFEPGVEHRVRIPRKAISDADTLLCEAQKAGISNMPITGFDEYITIPGIHAVALEYGQRRIRLPLAKDMVVLGIAEVIANQDTQYRDLLSGIVDASRVVCDRYDRGQV